MNTPIVPTGAQTAILFRGQPIAFVMFDGIPFFSLADVAEALNAGPSAARAVAAYTFPDHAKRTAEEVTTEGVHNVTVLSPVGVWLLTALIDPYGGQAIARWAKQQAERICPDPAPNDPGMYLQPTAWGDLPPCPRKYSGRLAEWWALKHAGAHLEVREALRRQAHQRDMEVVNKLYESRMAEQAMLAAAQEAAQ